ncbi:hypothetical protein [Jiangella alba]|uniref:DNA segregation ATPase FtsK/SpoIIIE, S-DNA-T family n=1 Tax=Jiangella alba TaxID=561176 RepID=A0A1H5PLH8_9ACTN|nr:hypothetical protein [Jiangella alba]SEF14763.1 hypothetical protein SAMN04488561_4727 [Jiangella alba]
MNPNTALTLAKTLPLGWIGRHIRGTAHRGWSTVRWPFRHLILTLTIVTVAVLVTVADGPLLLAAAVAPVALGVVWHRLHPRSFAPIRSRLLGSIRGPLLYRWRWRRLCQACGLTKKPNPKGDEEAPILVRVRAVPAGDQLHVRLRAGQIPDDFTRRAEDLAHALSAREVRVTSPKPGWVRLLVSRRDVLADGLTLTTVAPSLDLTRVPFAVGEDGMWRHRSYANVSGEVGGGLPGSGKTAGETSLVAGLMQNPAVQFVVIDGKGGQDWAWIAPRASIYIADDEDFTVVRDALATVVRVAQHRVRTQRERRGNSNYWNLPIVPEHPWLVVIVDEVQTWTEARAITDKAQRELANEITALMGRLVKKYRSAGVVTRLLTQKPTGDTLPTHIRDNTSIRTAWRVKSRAAAVSILGDDALDGTTITPTGISELTPGVAVVADDKGNLERVRFPYVPEDLAERIATDTAHHRRDLRTLLPLVTPSLTPADSDDQDDDSDVAA